MAEALSRGHNHLQARFYNGGPIGSLLPTRRTAVHIPILFRYAVRRTPAGGFCCRTLEPDGGFARPTEVKLLPPASLLAQQGAHQCLKTRNPSSSKPTSRTERSRERHRHAPSRKPGRRPRSIGVVCSRTGLRATSVRRSLSTSSTSCRSRNFRPPWSALPPYSNRTLTSPTALGESDTTCVKPAAHPAGRSKRGTSDQQRLGGCPAARRNSAGSCRLGLWL
jgi:hypothetical protein